MVARGSVTKKSLQHSINHRAHAYASTGKLKDTKNSKKKKLQQGKQCFWWATLSKVTNVQLVKQKYKPVV
jgi:hypothetical protein